MILIIGLGNPGIEYARTRHNVGFLAIDAIAKEKHVQLTKNEHHGLTGTFFENGQKVMLVKPQTYMNLSGRCVRELADYYDVPLEDILVIYDDIDLELGQLRIRKKGSAGTHNGMRSILEELGDGGFPRVRMGIGKKPAHWDLADFVLAKIDDDAMESVEDMCAKVAQGVDFYLKQDIDVAMNRINRKPKKPVVEKPVEEPDVVEAPREA